MGKFLKERDGGATKKTLQNYPVTDDLKSGRQSSLACGSVVQAVLTKGTAQEKNQMRRICDEKNDFC